ncbi:hypothetical protein WA158_003634 [Blastocystis sp. Blastoise]
MSEKKSLRIALLHPDLGIGGAERLMVDLALACQNNNNQVDIYTSHHDDHSFEETKDGTLNVYVHGDFIPRHLFHHFFIFFSTLRALYLSLVVSLNSSSYDLILCDTNAAYMPLLRLLTNSKIFFYCHMPDQYLCIRTSLLKKIYRIPFDLFEEFCMCFADKVCVNSLFTRDKYKKCFSHIQIVPDASVLYPCVNIKEDSSIKEPNEYIQSLLSDSRGYFVSLNRYERKKCVERCIYALKIYRDKVGIDLFNQQNIHLVIMGGYDTRVKENVDYYCELEQLAKSFDLSSNVSLLKSPSEETRNQLIYHSLSLIYTPTDEHFGIVPLESMILYTPVIAHASGGPKETVIDGYNGFLFNDENDIADDMIQIVNSNKLRNQLGQHGRKRVLEVYFFLSFF